jgi:hypothetical protein
MRTIASYARAMQILEGRRHLMKRIAIVIGIVIGIAATSAASDSNGQSQRRGISDRYELARSWNTPHGELYGPVQVAPSTFGFYSK